MKKLILIEGLPGSGKSTTAQWLHHSFRESGLASRWFYELSEHHPLSLPSDEGKSSVSHLLSVSVDMWKRFIRSEMNEYDAVIIDSGFFQKNIMYMMNVNIGTKTIQNYARQVEALLSDCDTHFIYLDDGDAHTHMRRVFQARGKRFQKVLTEWTNNTDYSTSKGYTGLAGGLKYWADYKDLCDYMYKKSQFRKIEIGVNTGPWAEHYQTLSRFLNVSNVDNSKGSPVLSGKVSGDFLMRNSDIRVNITEKSGYFTVKNLLHALEVESVLIPDGSNRFFIRGHDVSLQFEEYHQGFAHVVKVMSSWNKLNGRVFDRVTLS